MTGLRSFNNSTSKRVLNLLQTGWLRLRELIVERIAGIEFLVNDKSVDSTGSWWIMVRPVTAKLTNMIVARFGERCNLVWEGQMFVKDEAEISSRVGGIKKGIVYFGKLVFESNKQDLVLEELRVRRLAVLQEEICWRAFWRWVMLESKLGGWKEKNSWVSST